MQIQIYVDSMILISLNQVTKHSSIIYIKACVLSLKEGALHNDGGKSYRCFCRIQMGYSMGMEEFLWLGVSMPSRHTNQKARDWVDMRFIVVGRASVKVRLKINLNLDWVHSHNVSESSGPFHLSKQEGMPRIGYLWNTALPTSRQSSGNRTQMCPLASWSRITQGYWFARACILHAMSSLGPNFYIT